MEKNVEVLLCACLKYKLIYQNMFFVRFVAIKIALKKRTRTNETESQVTGTTYICGNTSSSWNCFIILELLHHLGTASSSWNCFIILELL